MHVFVTGASGWIGRAVVDDLLASGHTITGLARSDDSAAALEAKGVRVRRGDLDDLDGIRAGADAADATIHLANKHDWANMAASNAAERGAVAAIGDALAGTDRPLLLASGLAGLKDGDLATEDDASPFHGPDAPRGGTENLALGFAGRGVRSVAVRFSPTTHGTGDHGFVAALCGIARQRGVSGYPGEGANRWPAVHVADAARMVVLGLEKAPAGARLHAVAEEGVPTRAIAEAIGRAFDLPVASVPTDRVGEHFGWIGGFFSSGMAASSAATQRLLGWAPTGPTLIDDIDGGAYRTGQ
ncbi:SDR family oxidoreductase [Mycolicibacterium lacusdiani]|uniref:SDR family oxidoreductase n=1 Tax=Mycolicibacterium lacusdiani TaxID=2895283 RepID=UPI001F439FB6|nr:SDR family oxidoreductase [Mycolicibacterium lacusdiani]